MFIVGPFKKEGKIFDFIILHNIDVLFNFAEMSTARNNCSIFNSDVMVLEPCYRDYNCNWDISHQRVYASDLAHQTPWMKGCRSFAGCPIQERSSWRRKGKKARQMGFQFQFFA
nr:uncharacterized protein A4U43_C07F25020 [Ipomoea trifida]